MNNNNDNDNTDNGATTMAEDTLYIINTKRLSAQTLPVSAALAVWGALSEAEKENHTISKTCSTVTVDLPDEDDRILYFKDAVQAVAIHTKLKAAGRNSAVTHLPEQGEPQTLPVSPIFPIVKCWHQDDEPQTLPDVKPLEISEVAVERIAEVKVIEDKWGIERSPTVYTPGQRVVSLGDDNFRTSRREHEESPETIPALREVWTRAYQECRVDIFDINPADISMTTSGRLVLPPGTEAKRVIQVNGVERIESFPVREIGLERMGLRQLIEKCGGVFPRAGSYMEAVDAELRAINWNRRTRREFTKSFRLRLRKSADGKGWNNYSSVGNNFGAVDTHEVAAILGRALKGQGTRGNVTYDPATTKLTVDAIYHPENLDHLACGDVFKAGVRFKSVDTGNGGISAWPMVWRNLCLNLIIIALDKGTDLLGRKGWHNQSPEELRKNVKAAAEQSVEFLDDFAAQWGILRNTNIYDIVDTSNVKMTQKMTEWATINEKVDPQRLLIAEMISRPELKGIVAQSVLAEALLTGWQEEPGNTAADFVNAVTRAHTLNAMNEYQVQQMEVAAGRLVKELVLR